MRYKKTCELVNTILFENKEMIEIKGHTYSTPLLLPYKQKKCVELLYTSQFSDLNISVEYNDVFLKISLFTSEGGGIARLTYKKEDGKLIFDPDRSKGYSKLSRVNKNILIPEVEKCKEYKNGSMG